MFSPPSVAAGVFSLPSAVAGTDGGSDSRQVFLIRKASRFTTTPPTHTHTPAQTLHLKPPRGCFPTARVLPSVEDSILQYQSPPATDSIGRAGPAQAPPQTPPSSSPGLSGGHCQGRWRRAAPADWTGQVLGRQRITFYLTPLHRAQPARDLPLESGDVAAR